ncbi:M14 family metallopeptidase [Winogradskyella sp. UBA3174]|uniref:M14 family metallopeptidase n=1 Tax=Winogradskyella sp. UBA3174 TaxID=1947785 RepID=UPI0025F5BF68|nr:M14 family metallopeptidase [Winogradskyella sp. UBA3174]|tara:strand:- start:15059 stop:16810 length:1752 start_codon:yes stop_codon:yes gene_type:complete
MKKLIILLLIITSCTDKTEQKYDAKTDIDFTTAFEKSKGLETATYKQTIKYYRDLADSYSEVSIEAIGETDSGKPLHIVTLNMTGSNDDFKTIRKYNRILLINNGIHPGESDGIDATMLLYRDIVQGKIEAPKRTVLVTIPIYNIGGSLNRNSGTRTNQNGPKEYGFRGNARNYDLNRDFIKSDTKNARAFAQIFHLVQPDVFIDNHVSNGADYQYTLTHLFTQHNKLGGKLGAYLHTQMMPQLKQKLEAKSWDITPYVNVFNRTPESGFSQFMDSPRYSTGYTTLFNTLGMMVETHMLKPYKQRVEGTYELMKSMLEITEEQGDRITELRNEQAKTWSAGNTYPLAWAIDTTKSSILKFKGYEGEMIPSELTGVKRLKYDVSKPFTKDVNYQNYFSPTTEVTIPKAYIIPQGWHNVIDLLKLNNVEFTQVENDTTLTVQSYKIEDYKTRTSAYEGHYSHYDTKVKVSKIKLRFRTGDYIIMTNQKAMRYLLETLEPTAPDSFFNWNFFDTILQQKEGFSPYVWEDKAQQLLRANPKLQIEYNIKVSYEEDFANNWYAQLDWLHKQSGNYEKAHLQYPVYRIN